MQVARRLAPDGAAADVKALNPADAVLLPGNALRDIITVLHAHEQLGFCPREQLLAGTSGPTWDDSFLRLGRWAEIRRKV